MKAEDRDPVDFLRDILDSVDKIGSFIEGLDFDEFAEDDKTVYAVIRALEIMGEATKNLPESLKKNHPEVPWRKMTGTRDKVIHGYFGVDLEVVWSTVNEDIPSVKPLIEKILGEMENC
ncbi:DUF86 domain-containing protein [Methanosarcina sp. DH2]|jgi:uncharacterized protein with HEPN domain|uniref:HepT-like ribonuclease domain-containing protein n=2 Tax=unclassified Methanosarcina TaxID=2644672 RepID=UPI001E5F1DD6|nr:DUF86 domain-containing protein [Methanosarcina sp. DH2]MCC4771615.1 DUF86 domain-containing protein [Methanosarcina sp. DH2]